jgi:hypothetical protein
LVKVCFPLDFACRAQRGIQLGPPPFRHAGQSRVDQPGSVWAGQVLGRDRWDAVAAVFLRAEGVVLVAVPGVAVQGQGVHLPIADPGAGLVGGGVELGADFQPGAMVVDAMLFTMTSWLVSGQPRQFIVMWEKSRVRSCSTSTYPACPAACDTP